MSPSPSMTEWLSRVLDGADCFEKELARLEATDEAWATFERATLTKLLTALTEPERLGEEGRLAVERAEAVARASALRAELKRIQKRRLSEARDRAR